ncbi:MAG TPA: thiamine pyrophosphate-dependent dehydrogenase E1 component subunit alpha [Chloroflexota bacterium]|nr:thiamine pyrophosphate-dependent dehydrogenase E1 component subunit alpha [Chloroflexota bacterium]
MSVMREMVVGPHLGQTTTKEPASSDLSEDDLRRTYRLMALTRAIDEKAWNLNRQGRLPFVASCRGHEAAQVGSALALRAGHDIVFTYYRDIGVALTLGMEPRDLFFSSFAKPSPVNGNSRHLPWHLIHDKLKLMPVTSVVGTQIPQAAGAALASKIKREDAVTIVYFGDGATSEGDFHEGMNWAGVHKLPLIFFCENNGYAISIPVARQMPVVNVADRAQAYGFEGVTIDGTDPEAVFRATRLAAEKARSGGGPTLIEAKVRRLRPHSSDDDDRRYLSEQEREALQRHDPMDAFRQCLLRRHVLDGAALAAVDAEMKDAADQAAKEAELAPDARVEDILKHVFAES